MPKLTLKNTKQELLDALNAAERKLKEQAAVAQTPVEAAKAAADNKIVADAKADVKSGIFSDEMNAKFTNLTTAIELQEKYLKDLYGVEKAMADMATVIAGKKIAVQQLDEDLTRRSAEIESQLSEAKDRVQREIKDLETAHKQRAAELQQQRVREQEEFDYNLRRSRQMEEDAYKDSMTARAKETAAAQQRLDELTAKIEEIEALKARAAGLDVELQAKYDAGVEDGKKQAGKDWGFQKSMLEKDHGYEIRSRDEKIERLESEVESRDSKIVALEEKLDKAYAQLRELATKTVESSGSLKVISAGDAGSGSKK